MRVLYFNYCRFEWVFEVLMIIAARGLLISSDRKKI